MRLYNAASCTPWEPPTKQRPKLAQSFVPVVATLSHRHDDNESKEDLTETAEELSTNDGAGGTSHRRSIFYRRNAANEKLNAEVLSQEEPSRTQLKHNGENFRYLTKIPSMTTSTGGETPPVDNTTYTPSSGVSRSQRVGRAKTEIKALGILGNRTAASLQIGRVARSDNDSVSQLRLVPPRLAQNPRAANKRGVWADHGGNGSKIFKPKIVPHTDAISETVNEADLDPLNDTMESSSSTLTTTRSMMMLEDREECAIIVSSISTTRSEMTLRQEPSKRVSTLNLGAAAPKVPIQRTRNIVRDSFGALPGYKGGYQEDDHREYPSPPLSIASIGTSSKSPSDTFRPTKRNEQEDKNCLQTPPAPNTVVNREPQRVTPDASQTGAKMAFSRRFQVPALVPSHSGELDKDYSAVKAGLRKVSANSSPPPQQDRIDFFPTQKAGDLEKESVHESPRLGASGFPSLKQHQIDTSTSQVSEEDSWDPFNDDAKKNGSEDLSWINFDDRADAESTDDWTVEAPWHLSFPTEEINGIPTARDTPITALLGDHQDKDDGRYSHDAKGDNGQGADRWLDDSNDIRFTRDIQKINSKGSGEGARVRLSRHDFLQKPKLLGPLLEKRFTRSYWRRLKGTKKDSLAASSKENSLLAVEGRSSATGNGAGHDKGDESAVRTGEVPPSTTKQVMEGHVSAALKEGWQISAPADSSELRGNSGKLEAVPSADAGKILSPQRRKECNAILDGLGISSDRLLEAVDTAAASSDLTKEHILSVYTLMPKPKERHLLLMHVQQSRKEASFLLPERSENLMLQLMGMDELQQKIEALLFQHEFPDAEQKLFSDCHTLQMACEEILRSSRLEKVLGITNMLGNRLVGKTPGKKKTNKVSLRSLLAMMEETEMMEKGNDQAFLFYACSRIQKTKPALLMIKEELPSLPSAVISAESIGMDLEELEARFEAFREFALSFSLGGSSARSSVELSVQEEVDVLQATPVGAFAIKACVRMAEVYEALDIAQQAYDALVSEFSEEEGSDGHDKPDIGRTLETFARFTSYVERFN